MKSLEELPRAQIWSADGVDVVRKPGEAPEFIALEAISDAEVAQLAGTVARRVTALLKRRQQDEEGNSGSDPAEETGLTDVYAASILGRVEGGPRAGQRLKTAGDRVEVEELEDRPGRRCATVSGYSLHANVALPANDRQRLARLIQYVARPPVCGDRLDGMEDGRLVYRFKTLWRNGTCEALFEPEDFIARLAALVPKPRAHLTRYSGELAPATK